MTTYVIRRVLALIPVLIVVSLITFALMHLAPGGPFDQVDETRRRDPAIQQRAEAAFGLNKPWYEQYFTYMSNAVRLNLGPSYSYKDRNVTDLLKEHIRYSAELGVMAVIFAVLFGLPLGVIAALRQNTWVDYLALFLATMGVAIPSFVLSLYLILLFSSTLHWVDVAPDQQAFDTTLKPWILPVLALGLPTSAALARFARSAMLDVIRQDYIRTARAKGLRNQVIVARHMVKNAMIPVWTIIGPLTAGLVTGSFIVEDIFSIPGIGRYFVSAIGARDYSMIMGTTLVYCLLVIIFNLLTDVTYGLFDPRVKVSK
ncbi:MAG TPA: ABC transporter permease [Chloroflexia bacterium]|nr:ABC transporter permease [Chloroflexia bacterium]